jgi:hypothetical protein
VLSTSLIPDFLAAQAETYGLSRGAGRRSHGAPFGTQLTTQGGVTDG